MTLKFCLFLIVIKKTGDVSLAHQRERETYALEKDKMVKGEVGAAAVCMWHTHHAPS